MNLFLRFCSMFILAAAVYTFGAGSAMAEDEEFYCEAAKAFKDCVGVTNAAACCRNYCDVGCPQEDYDLCMDVATNGIDPSCGGGDSGGGDTGPANCLDSGKMSIVSSGTTTSSICEASCGAGVCGDGYIDISSFSVFTQDCATYGGSVVFIDSCSADNGCGYDWNRSYPISSCTSCSPGYDLVSFTDVMNMTEGTDYSVSGAQYSMPDSSITYDDTYGFNVCVNCLVTSLGDWESSGNGYERQELRFNPNCRASVSYAYRCAAGYYSSTGLSDAASVDALGCEPCPNVCNNVETTSSAGAASVGSCCAAAGSAGSDEIGSFSLNAKTCAS